MMRLFIAPPLCACALMMITSHPATHYVGAVGVAFSLLAYYAINSFVRTPQNALVAFNVLDS